VLSNKCQHPEDQRSKCTNNLFNVTPLCLFLCLFMLCHFAVTFSFMCLDAGLTDEMNEKRKQKRISRTLKRAQRNIQNKLFDLFFYFYWKTMHGLLWIFNILLILPPQFQWKTWETNKCTTIHIFIFLMHFNIFFSFSQFPTRRMCWLLCRC
jgi:hypothetical protein